MDIFFDLFLSKTRRRNAPTRIGRRVLCVFFCEVDAFREKRDDVSLACLLLLGRARSHATEEERERETKRRRIEMKMKRARAFALDATMSFYNVDLCVLFSVLSSVSSSKQLRKLLSLRRLGGVLERERFEHALGEFPHARSNTLERGVDLLFARVRVF